MLTYNRDGLTFRALSMGAPHAELVVLLHGFPADAESWLPVAEQLASAGYSILIPEQRGYSSGARPRGRRAYRLSELVEDTRALIDAAGVQPIHLVGHDWGGTVAWAFAAKYPECVSSLTIVSTPHPRALTAALWRSRQALLSWYMLLFQLPRLPEWILTINQGAILIRALTKSGLNHQSASRYVAHFKDPSLLTAALGWYRAIPFNLASPPAVRTIQSRTQFIYGAKDDFLSLTAARLTKQWVVGEYTFKLLPDQTHWIPENSPALLAKLVLEFIKPEQA